MRYYSLSRFFRERFGFRVYKLPVYAGFTCPNRNGTISDKGCIFCWNPSFSPALGDPAASLRAQIAAGKAAVKRKEGCRFLVYFQPYTNTYAPVEKLRLIYDSALADPDVIGMCIGTRPDCVPDAVLDLLAEYAARWHVWVEYGLQSAHDRTLLLLNRGHTRADFEDAVARSQGRGLFLCAHVILGLPGETREDMLETALFLSSQPIQGVKIHHLQVIENTPLAEMYREGRVQTLGFEEYLSLVCDFLELLRPDLVIHRLVGEVLESRYLLAPHWGVGKAQVLSAIEKELELRGSRQGSKWRQMKEEPGIALQEGLPQQARE
ncbi:MAG: TIGR01212 family radical SAM protein [Firmicutes bacterium]|nr:TIGR01212 family radical SAM protein [Bacillota bacterium]